MPGIDNGVGNVEAAVPYSWEAAPGKPVEDVMIHATELPRVPLPLPPGSRGVRKPATFLEPTFGGFAPVVDVPKSTGPHFAEKLFKKLHAKLKKKSKLLAASFASENTKEHSKRVSVSDGSVQTLSYDSDENLQRWSSSSTFDQPDTPLAADSGSLSPMSSLSSSSTSWESFGYSSATGSERSIDLILATSSSGDFNDCLSGARESAWQEETEEEEELTEQEWQIVRYASLQQDGSSLISTLVRQSSLTAVSDHSYQFSSIRGRKAELE